MHVRHDTEVAAGYNIILAGVPRSGSTLLCRLLNQSANVVALHEPISPRDVPLSPERAFVEYLENYFGRERCSIHANGEATSKSWNGAVPDNPVFPPDETGKRLWQLNGKRLIVNRDLPAQFSIAIKQPGLFTGSLEVLVKHFPCFATIRNPLGVLGSWNSVDMPMTQGRAPAAERCDPLLRDTLERETDLHKRQLILLSWYFDQIARHLPADNVIRYERLVEAPGEELARIQAGEVSKLASLRNQNFNPAYDWRLLSELGRKLLDSDGAYWSFYAKGDVASLIESSTGL
jgi:hypothetical protein